MTATELRRLHERLEIPPDALLSAGTRPAGRRFRGYTITAADAWERSWNGDADHWIGSNGLQGDIPAGSRGTAADLAAVYAVVTDLDIKPKAMPDDASARTVIDTLAAMLGTAPAAVVPSGHGFQPYWAVEDPEDPRWPGLLRCFDSLSRMVARRNGGDTDHTKDAARVWRVPGSINMKSDPVPVTLELPEVGWHPIDADTMAEVLDEYGIPQEEVSSGKSDVADIDAVIAAMPKGDPCRCMERAAGKTAASGNRHELYNSAALTVLRYGRRGCPGAVQVLTRMHDQFVAEVTHPGSSDRRSSGEAEAEWERNITGAVRLVVDEPQGRGCPDTTRKPAPITTGADTVLGALETEPLGQRIADEAKDHYLYVHGIGWHAWDGRCWHRGSGTDKHVHAWVAKWIKEAIKKEVDAGTDTKIIAPLLRYRHRSDGLVEAMTLNPRICCDADDLDHHPHLLNCANGVVDLTDGTIAPHDRALRFTKVTDAAYRPGHTHTDWEAALEALPQDARDYLKIRFGQAITGRTTPDDRLVILGGGGANGKTTVLGAVLNAIGPFGQHIQDSLLMGTDQRERGHENTVLLGLRFAAMEELPEGKRLNAARMKKILGTSRIAARFLYKDPFSFTPSHSIFLTTNYLPQVGEVDHGTWRRLMLIDFPYKYVDHEPERDNERAKDVQLRDRVLYGEDQQAAILTWLVEGAVAYSEAGDFPTMPDSIRNSTEAWRRRANPVAAYCDEFLVENPEGRISSQALYQHFETWAQDNGYRGINQETFNGRVTAIYPNAGRSPGPTKARTTSSPPGVVLDAPGKQYRAWLGLDFRAPEAGG